SYWSTRSGAPATAGGRDAGRGAGIAVIRNGARRGTRVASLAESLSRVRLRLTAWYVGTLFAILALLGVGLFATITVRFDREVDSLLAASTRELIRVARVRDSAANRVILATLSEAKGRRESVLNRSWGV